MPIRLIEKSIYLNAIYSLTAICVFSSIGCNSSGVANIPKENITRTSSSCPPFPHALEDKSGRYLEPSSGTIKTHTILQKLHGHIPHGLNRFSDFGKIPNENEIPFTVSLKLNNESELDMQLEEMYRPGSSTFHKFLTPSAFHSRFSPTQTQVDQVRVFLQSNNIQTLSISSNRSFIHAKGKVASLNSMLHTEIHQYRDPQGQLYFAPAYEPQVPAEIPIQAIHGLQNVTHFKSYAHSLAINSAVANGGSGPNGGYTPKDIQNAYQIPSSITGTGQTLALFELDGYTESDVSAYESHFNLPSVPLENILVDGASGTPSGTGGENEVTLDVELMVAIAPGVSKILVYEGPNNDQGMLDTYSKIADDNLAREISTSWGISESQTTSALSRSENNIFKQMAAQGQSIYAAAGDNGANDNGSSLSVDDPGSQPYVVGVGGTKLSTRSDGSYLSETTWNESSSSRGAGGGGTSTMWTLPSWQKGVATSQNLGSSTMRNVPDVSLNSDPNTGYAIYTGGNWTIFGGTSCAAPLWAAFTALVNQLRDSSQQTPLGFPNPALYQIAQSSHYQSDFYDVADGSTNQYYPATAGYDNATGWGTLKGQYLLEDLAQNPPISSGSGSTPNCGLN